MRGCGGGGGGGRPRGLAINCRGGFNIRPRVFAPPQFPGLPPRLPRLRRRAFTPAAPWQFQNRNVRAAAGFGGMGASRPTAARVAAAVPVGPKHEIDS